MKAGYPHIDCQSEHIAQYMRQGCERDKVFARWLTKEEWCLNPT